uniref:Uncharacterized protein n=1 Tax=Timema bartmani TaxID=61472 RepID=A0A7R9F235_9NEOP|nr:unnamed protein product [Timema bartmani]
MAPVDHSREQTVLYSSLLSLTGGAQKVLAKVFSLSFPLCRALQLENVDLLAVINMAASQLVEGSQSLELPLHVSSGHTGASPPIKEHRETSLYFRTPEQPLFSILESQWTPDSDNFSYRIRVTGDAHKPTKRNVLSTFRRTSFSNTKTEGGFERWYIKLEFVEPTFEGCLRLEIHRVQVTPPTYVCIKMYSLGFAPASIRASALVFTSDEPNKGQDAREMNNGEKKERNEEKKCVCSYNAGRGHHKKSEAKTNTETDENRQCESLHESSFAQLQRTSHRNIFTGAKKIRDEFCRYYCIDEDHVATKAGITCYTRVRLDCRRQGDLGRVEKGALTLVLEVEGRFEVIFRLEVLQDPVEHLRVAAVKTGGAVEVH